MNNIDYEALNKRGFLRQKQNGFFILRTRTTEGNYNADQLSAIAGISKEYGRGIIHTTIRQGLEVPFIKLEDIDKVEKMVHAAGIEMGASGPGLRSTTSCPGNNWCKSGLIDTFGLFKRIEKELDIRCSMDLPHKFKIAISGCPNTCTRAQVTEIGIHGQIDTKDRERRVGYAVYLGGCGGRNPQTAFKLERVFTEDEVLSLVKRTVEFYKRDAKPRQRLALLIEEVGKEKFLREIGC